MTDTDIAQELVAQLETAWNQGDGEAYGAAYAPDASFVNVRGERLEGREAIASGHSGIFTTIYRGSHNTMELLTTESLAADVLLATTRNTLDVPAGPLAGVRQAMSTNVLTRRDGTWHVACTHNTLVETGR